MRSSSSTLLLLALTGALSAQSITVPNGTAGTEGNTLNAFPWATLQSNIPGVRIQDVYDNGDFTAQGVTGPVLIYRARWRANSTTVTWSGGRWDSATVMMSTCPHDWSTISTTTGFSFPAHQGADNKVCYAGPVDFLPGVGATPGPTVVDIAFDTPFVYDPALGDCVIDSDLLTWGHFTPAGPGSVWITSIDVKTIGAAAARTVASTTYPTAQLAQNPHGAVVTFDYVPATSILYPAFTPSVREGTGPLTVNFTDQTYTTDPGGVLTWQWDFNGDSVVDSTVQNPSFTYTSCGNFDVTLTVTDAVHGTVATTRTAAIKVDGIKADFTMAFFSAPGLFQFTDTSTPPATAWAWDFNGDSIVDSTAQNPIALLSLCQAATVSLTATRNCQSNTVTKPLIVSAGKLDSNWLTTTAGSSANTWFCDLTVTNPLGVNICALDVNAASTTLPLGAGISVDVYVSPGGSAGKQTTIASWRQVASGAGQVAGIDLPSHLPLANKVYLPAGTYGMALKFTSPATTGVPRTPAGTSGTYSNSDLTLTMGSRSTALFGGTVSAAQWSWSILYDTPQTGGMAGIGYFENGCAGTLAASKVTVVSGPVLGGTFSASFNNLPLNFVDVVIGFSRTAWGPTPLPLDLNAAGLAPVGCLARVSLDMENYTFGSASVATFSSPVPSTSSLLGLPFFMQGAVLESSSPLQVVVSEAWAGVIGG